MKFISDMGVVFRLSERNYLRLLRTIAADQSFDISTFGKQVCIIDKNVTDMQAGDAQMELDWMKSQKHED